MVSHYCTACHDQLRLHNESKLRVMVVAERACKSQTHLHWPDRTWAAGDEAVTLPWRKLIGFCNSWKVKSTLKPSYWRTAGPTSVITAHVVLSTLWQQRELSSLTHFVNLLFKMHLHLKSNHAIPSWFNKATSLTMTFKYEATKQFVVGIGCPNGQVVNYIVGYWKLQSLQPSCNSLKETLKTWITKK